MEMTLSNKSSSKTVVALDRPKSLFSYQCLQGRTKTSSGLWVSALLPFACCPGFYGIHSGCRPSPQVLPILALQVGASSLYILYKLCQREKNTNENGPNVSKTLWNLLTPYSYLPPISSYAALLYFTDLDVVTAFLCSFVCWFLHQQLTKWIFNNFRKSFSIGEGLLVGQAGALAFTMSFKAIVNPPKAKMEHQQIVLFVQTAIAISSIFAYFIWRFRGRITLCYLMSLLAFMGSVGIGISSLLLKEWTLTWLMHLFSSSPTRIALFGWWANLSILIVITAVISQRWENVAQTVMRKIFHLLMVLVIVPGTILDPTLTYFATTAVLILFLLLEIIRVTKIEPFSCLLNSIFGMFLDEKDSGPLVLSHIYLLAGLACPLWLYPCNFIQVNYIDNTQPILPVTPDVLRLQFSVMPLLAGVIAVGIGDTAASIGGTYFGRHMWRGTKKTIEGSICSIFFQLAFIGLVVLVGSINLSWNSWPKFIISVLFSTIVEAFTDQVDNLILPLILYIPLMDP